VGEGKYMEVYNVHQALKILQQYYITDSIQMVTRWIREGKIKANVRQTEEKVGGFIRKIYSSLLKSRDQDYLKLWLFMNGMWKMPFLLW
jgi:hypothetical protein